VKRYIFSNRVTTHNPIEFYLNALPVWDGQDHIRALAATVPTSNLQWPDHFYRWFLGMVAQWLQLDKTHANSVLPLLVGPQGNGKSTWCRNLLPIELREYYTDSIDFSSRRDAEMALSCFALINLDEFDAISVRHQPYLKHLLQKPEVNTRRPYKTSISAMKRFSVFIGTCNNKDLLSDPTGNRRFLCIEIEGLIDNEHPLPYEQLYAQAVEALRKSERYWFDREEEMSLINNNTAFEVASLEEQLLTFHFEPAKEEEGEWLPAVEIIKRLQQIGKQKFSNVHTRHFGRVLRKHQYPMKHTKEGNLYYVKQRDNGK